MGIQIPAQEYKKTTENLNEEESERKWSRTDSNSLNLKVSIDQYYSNPIDFQTRTDIKLLILVLTVSS